MGNVIYYWSIFNKLLWKTWAMMTYMLVKEELGKRGAH